ncbi:MAG: hypothetical protein NTY61_00950 [Candidatus Parcubacteria bacterium]|nr:hypothetical protein [Candidatus Parcubacteria bacterium]
MRVVKLLLLGMAKQWIIAGILFLLVLLSASLLVQKTFSLLIFSQYKLSDFIAAIVYFILFLVFLLLGLGLIERREIIYSLAPILALLLFFFFSQLFQGNDWIYYLIGLVIFCIFIIIAFESICSEKKSYRKVMIGRAWKRAVPLVVIGFSLLVCVIYYFHPLIKFQDNKVEIPPRLIKWVVAPLSPMLGKLLPFYSPGKTVDDLLKAEMTTPSSSSDIDLSKLDPAIQKQIKKEMEDLDPQLLAQARSQLAQSLGIALTGQEKIDDLLVTIINGRLGSFIGPYSKIVFWAIIVILFFSIKSVLDILALFSLLLARIIFNLLRLMKIVKIEKEMAEVEVMKI